MDTRSQHLFLLGSSGRLGRVIDDLAKQQGFVVVPLTRADLFSLNAFERWLKKIPASHAPGVLLDVSLPAATENWTSFLQQLIHNTSLPLFRGFVVGTTGLSPQTQERLEQLAKIVPVCVAPNFSRGIWLLEEILQAQTTGGCSVAELIENFQFDVGLAETHHQMKKDAPSGTALSLAKYFGKKSGGLKPEKISSLRVGHVIGEHRLLLGHAFEDITITHQTHSRQTYAQGALDLCRAFSAKYPPVPGKVLSPGEVMGAISEKLLP